MIRSLVVLEATRTLHLTLATAVETTEGMLEGSLNLYSTRVIAKGIPLSVVVL